MFIPRLDRDGSPSSGDSKKGLHKRVQDTGGRDRYFHGTG